MVPPCFAAPLQARPCALASASICAVTGAPGVGLAHGASPAQLRGHLPLRACLPGSIVRAFCQALSGRTLLIQAVCFLPKGIRTPCSYYNTQKRWICQPGNWFVLTASVLALSGAPRQLSQRESHWQAGQAVLFEQSLRSAETTVLRCFDSRLLNLALSVTCGDSSPKGRANCGSRPAVAESRRCVGSPFGGAGIKRSADD